MNKDEPDGQFSGKSGIEEGAEAVEREDGLCRVGTGRVGELRRGVDEPDGLGCPARPAM